MIWVSQQGGEKKYRFPDLANLSNRYSREIEFVGELPKTIYGTIKHNELRAAGLKRYRDHT